MPHALALIAAAVSTAALLVVVFLTLFVVSLSFRAKREAGSRTGPRDLEMPMIGEPHNRLRTRCAPNPGVGADPPA